MRGTSYVDSIKPFQRRKDRCSTLLALISQYTGAEKWKTEIKKQSHLLHTRQWRGQAKCTLERFVQLHRNAFISKQVCAQHVSYQLPNEHSRVGYMLDAIENDDADLQAALANIKDDTGTNGKREYFEKAVAHMLPKDPVLKRQTAATKRTAADICNSTVSQTRNGGGKQGIGATGVHLRYYIPEEYLTLNSRQKDKLKKWREESRHVGKNATNNKKQTGN